MEELNVALKAFKTIKIIGKILLAVFLFLIIILCGLHIFINLAGKPLVVKKLSDAFGQEVKVGIVNTSFPASIHIKDIEAKGVQISELIAGSGVFDLFRKRFRLSFVKVIQPEITTERISYTPKVALPEPPSEGLEQATEPQAVSEPKPEEAVTELAAELVREPILVPRFLIRRVVISDGTINFTDRIAEDQSIKIKANKINLTADNLNFSGSGNQVTYFKLTGSLPWCDSEEEAGKIEADGWVNLFKKDIQANVSIHDIDGIYLYPYYAKWVDLEKARIAKAKLNLTSKVQGMNNDLTAVCRLELTDIERKPRPPEESAEKAEKIADVVLDMFKALNEGKIVLDFTIKTKMDSPEFGIMDIKTAVEDKLVKSREPGFSPVNIFFLPVKIVEGSVKATTEITKAMIDGSFAVGNEFKNAVKGSFTREPPPAEEE
ncbi:MAG: hypothetical protein AMJ95_13205 [Omnitrophica WOR_2 bacterium SM23_72]|nr:MAG: hypothetical protein AMJ95_13205 [Omnitrophica WOR_2 bacterium SM23_72]